MRLVLATISVLMCAALIGADTTDAALELRASQAFNKGDYTQALPMLQKLATDLKDQPDKLGMIQEQIRVCQKNQQNQPVQVAAAPVSASTQPSLSTNRTPHPAPKPGEVLEMTIKELGNFDFDPENGSAIPDDVKALNGSTVRFHGFMIPMDEAENVSKFALVPSLFGCCQFGAPPQIQHTIIVTCPKGKSVVYCPDEIIVQGKLTVDELKEDGFIVSIFALESTSVKPAK